MKDQRAPSSSYGSFARDMSTGVREMVYSVSGWSAPRGVKTRGSGRGHAKSPGVEGKIVKAHSVTSRSTGRLKKIWILVRRGTSVWPGVGKLKRTVHCLSGTEGRGGGSSALGGGRAATFC